MPYDIIIGRNESDKKLFGEKGLINIGKGFVTMGNYTSLSNPIFLDVARSHVIMVAGKRGSGKCLAGDTLITLADGSQIPIKDLENNKDKIISLNEKLKVECSEKSDFFSRKTNKLLKIKLRSGKEIKLTPEHPLFTFKGWQEAQNLRVGGRIATPRIIPAFGNNEMPEHEVKLLSYLIAEGHTKKIVLFANSDEKIVSEFNDCLTQLDSSLKLIKEKESHYRISCPSWKNNIMFHDFRRTEKGQFVKGSKNIYKKRTIRKLIEREQIFGLLSTQKFLSQNIMRLKKEQLSIFLNRLFSCDGSIYYKKCHNSYCWQISYASSSERLIRQVQSLLLRFEILSRLRQRITKCNNKNFESFELIINAENALKFINEIGFYGRKEEIANRARSQMILIKRDTNVDTIPKEIWNMYKPQNWTAIGKAMHYKYPKAMRESIDYCPSRQKLLRIAEIEQSNPLMLLATSDIFWDEIISMEILEGEFDVYDICVPENHNFVANDILVHNSYTLGVIAEALSTLEKQSAENIASLIFDTMGIFWTMKYENNKDAVLLAEWGIQARNVPVKVFVPFGFFQEYKDKGIEVDEEFALKISELSSSDWVSLFEMNFIQQEAVLIENVIDSLKIRSSFGFEDIRQEIRTKKNFNQKIKNAVLTLFDAAEGWGVFSENKGTKISELISGGETSIIDLSMYTSIGGFNVRGLVIGLVCKKLFDERIVARRNEEIQTIQHGLDYLYFSPIRKMPLVWVFIDEAHEFLPRDGGTPASNALIQLLREGRQPGISIVLATQQPGKIHTDAITQSDIVISHRVTAEQDMKALNEIMQSYIYEGIKGKMNSLPRLKGSAIILDDNSERIYPMKVRPRFTWHGGETPISVRIEKDERI